jgi:OFA family oxalate/formate antiporter-like MFS transporter
MAEALLDPKRSGGYTVNRWIRLGAAVVAMIMIANLQYGWALFVKPIIGATGWKLSEIQLAFTIFIALETWAMPLCGFLIDRHGARALMTIAGVFCGAGWIQLGHAQSLPALYGWYALAGFGAAMVYCGSIGVALKWFPDKRGLASGVIAAGFGSGSGLFIPILSYILARQDYRAAFLYTGVAQGLIIVLAAQFLGKAVPVAIPAPKAAAKKTNTRTHGENFNSLEMLKTSHFYILYAAMTMMGIGGLMVTANTAVVADSIGIAAAVVPVALSINPFANGGGRIFWGWVSDHLGRERTMIIAFLIQAAALISVITIGAKSGLLFGITLALVFFTWGEVYVLFPSACADFFGSRNASSNYAFLYSTKGVASILGGYVAAILYERTGSWTAVFYGSAALALIATGLAAIIRKMPLPHREKEAVTAPAAGYQTARDQA